MLVSPEITAKLKPIAVTFLEALHKQDVDRLWFELVTEESRRFLAPTFLPVLAHKNGNLNRLFNVTPAPLGMSRTELSSLAFDADALNMRTGLFHGLSDGSNGGYSAGSLSDPTIAAMVEGEVGVVIGRTTLGMVIIPLLQEGDNSFKVDLSALLLFSMAYCPSDLFEIAQNATQFHDYSFAVTFLEIIASLADPFSRIDRFMVHNPEFPNIVKDKRKLELLEQSRYVRIARERLDFLVEGPKVESALDAVAFMIETFSGYGEIPSVSVSDDDMNKLDKLKDSDLRSALAKIIRGVDPVIAQREASKPHTGAEIADMELLIHHEGLPYYLCLPFKSGVEIKDRSVSINYAYQLTRPITEYQRAIVVFITAKPCSQPLHNHIRKLRDRWGWLIEVIEHRQLAALLKLNGLL